MSVAPVVKSIAVAVAGVFVVYLIAANVLLRTHLLRGWLDGHEEKLLLEYGSAWSLYPGHVTVRDLRLRVQDRNIQMSLHIDRVAVDIDLWALTQRVARFDHVDAEGVEYRMRHKVESIDGQEGRVSAFPPIDGFADPPVEARIDEPPQPEDAYKLWTIEVRDIHATVREVWTMEYRFRGEGTLAGGFHVRPRREVWVMPSVMLAQTGLLSLGDRELIRGGGWRLEAQLDPFDPREPNGLEVMRHVSLRLHQNGELVSLASVSKTYLEGGKIAIGDGAGPITLDVHIEHGVLQGDTRVTYRTEAATLSAGWAGAPQAFSVRSDLDFVAHVEPSAEGGNVIAELGAKHGVTKPPGDVHDLRGTIDLDNTDVTTPITIASLTGAFTSARVANLVSWQAFAPPDTTFQGTGSATFAGRAEYHHGALEGRLDALLDRVSMAIGPTSFTCSGKTSANVVSKDVAKDIAFPDAHVDLHDVSLHLLKGHEDGLWMRTTLGAAHVKTTSPMAFDTDFGVVSGPGDKTLKLFTRMASLPDLAADVTHGSQLEGAMHLRVRPDDIAFTVMHGKNGELQGRGRIHKRRDHPVAGAFLFSVGPVNMGLDMPENGFSVVPVASGHWLEETLQKR